MDLISLALSAKAGTPGGIAAAGGDLRNGRKRVAIGVLGQSVERGSVDPAETVAGVASISTFPLAYRSAINRGLAFPIAPAVSRQGGALFALHDAVAAAGYDVKIVNGAIGGLSLQQQGVGTILTRTNSTSYRQQRFPKGAGDRGFMGDIIVEAGKVFLCTTGNLCYATNNGIQPDLAPQNLTEMDFIRTHGTLTTASSNPGTFAAATVGATVTDGSIVWTCLSESTTWLAQTYTAGASLTESRVGFDPLGIIRRLHEEMSRTDADTKVIIIQNGQSDSSLTSSAYSNLLTQVALYYLRRGYFVLIGLSTFWPQAGTTAYNTLTSGVNDAVTTLKALAGTTGYTEFSAGNVELGANLYSVLGSTGDMGGASITGSIAGTTLTVSATSFGAVAIGQMVTGSGVSVGTYITGGSGSTWTVNNSQTVGSRALSCSGAGFAKDTGGDLLHPNAAKNIQIGAAMAVPVINLLSTLGR